MDIDTELGNKLQKLFDLQPTLTQEVGKADSLDQAVRFLVQAGEQHGITLAATDLTTALQAAGSHVVQGELNENQLAGVTGGMYLNWFLQIVKLIKPQNEEQQH